MQPNFEGRGGSGYVPADRNVSTAVAERHDDSVMVIEGVRQGWNLCLTISTLIFGPRNAMCRFIIFQERKRRWRVMAYLVHCLCAWTSQQLPVHHQSISFKSKYDSWPRGILDCARDQLKLRCGHHNDHGLRLSENLSARIRWAQKMMYVAKSSIRVILEFWILHDVVGVGLFMWLYFIFEQRRKCKIWTYETSCQSRHAVRRTRRSTVNTRMSRLEV